MTSSVRSADRTFAIFEAFENAQSPLSLGELAEVCDMPLSTCHSLVQTLLKRGYLYSIGKRKALYPTVRLLKMARNIATHDPFISRVSDILVALSEKSGETITLGKRQGESVLYLDAIDGTQAIRYAAHPGEYRPLHATALGKALLGEVEPEAFDTWLRTYTLQKITAKTIITKAKLAADITEGRKRGYFIASGELLDDLTSIAVPLKRYLEPLAISITGPTQRVIPLVDKFSKQLLEAKHQIEAVEEH